MNAQARALRSTAHKYKVEMQGILNSEHLTTEDETRFDELHRSTEALLAEAEKIEDQQLRATEVRKITENPANWTGQKRRGVERIAMHSFFTLGYVPEQLSMLMPRHRFAAQGTASGSIGGYLVPQGFADELEVAIRAQGGMWQASRLVRTKSGSLMPWPKVNDTNRKAYLIAESANMETSAIEVVFGSQNFESYKYTSGAIRVPNELLKDSELFEKEFIQLLAERIVRGTNDVFTNGDGTNKPKGVLAGAVYGTSSADDTALAFDDFVNLKHSVNAAYRNSDKCFFMFHDTVLKAISKLKSSTGGEPMFDINSGLILGHPFIVNDDMPEFAPGSASANDNDKAVLFGDFSKYIIRQVQDLSVYRMPDRYADQDQTTFSAVWRLDGDLLNAGTNPIKYMRMSAT